MKEEETESANTEDESQKDQCRHSQCRKSPNAETEASDLGGGIKDLAGSLLICVILGLV